MSIPNLSIDFKDDILNSSMNKKRKYQKVDNNDGSFSLDDVTVYSQEGSEYGAKEIIEERKAINNIYNERILNIEALELVTEPGFFVDAQVVKELNGKMTGAFSASDIQSVVASGVRGGWKRVGDIVFVDVKFNLVNSYKDAAIMKNLPVPRNDKSALAAANLSSGRVAFGQVNDLGDLEWHDSAQPATGNECSITGIYNCV